jgi:LPXTG-motif cell wall-anchored protein
VSIPRRVVVLLALLLACAPGPAYAQTTTLPQDGSGVSTTPPVPLDGGEQSPPAPNPPNAPPPANVSPSPPAAPDGSDLPNTGSDPRLLFLVGATLTLIGVGLRLRTADADRY